jgi:hypothetical protein
MRDRARKGSAPFIAACSSRWLGSLCLIFSVPSNEDEGTKRVPRTRRFIDSPELYDAIYRFKNYARECDRLRNLNTKFVPGTRFVRARTAP